MTLDEAKNKEQYAINRLQDAKDGYKEYLTDEAIDIAIEALEQEPATKNDLGVDCISRQAVLNTEYQVKIINDIEYVMLSEVQMKMRKLPSINPQPICEEREKGECPWYAG